MNLVKTAIVYFSLAVIVVYSLFATLVATAAYALITIL